MSKLIITCAMPRYRYHGSHPFMSKARQAAVDRERRFLANTRHIPDLFGNAGLHVEAAWRKRARDRVHTIVREQMYLRRNPISNYMPRRLLRNPKYKKYPRVRLPQQVYRKKPFGKFIKTLSDGRRLYQYGVKP